MTSTALFVQYKEKREGKGEVWERWKEERRG